MLVNLLFDAKALAAPQSFRDGVQSAANLIDAAFVNNITVNVAVGYGDFPDPRFPLGNAFGLGGPAIGTTLTYSELKTDLAKSASSLDDFTSLAFLPSAAPTTDFSQIFVASPIEKTFGLLAPNANSVDGNIGLSTQATGSALVTAAMHEIAHAMGRSTGVMDLFRYNAAGAHVPDPTLPAPATYFSIDGGRTNLADFGRSSDTSDFLNAPNDPFNEAGNGTSLTALDLTLMDVMGFQRPLAPARAPEVSFDQTFYLRTYPDIAAAQADAQTHFDNLGWKEGRNPNAVFNTSFYLARYPDVANAGVDPLAHYEQFGWKEGRDPSASFSTSHYLAVNPDVKLAGANPLDHYILYGQFEHRPI
jgi:hypothetical protein